MSPLFHDRHDAGRALAARLQSLAGRPGVVVLGLPRGGVPVAGEVAAALHAPLDVFVVRKIGVPGHEELAMGAVASGGVRVVNPDVAREVGITRQTSLISSSLMSVIVVLLMKKVVGARYWTTSIPPRKSV